MVPVVQWLDLPAGRQGVTDDMKYYVYIIRSQKDGKFYTGMTSDLQKRIDQHSKGRRNTPSTLHRGPFIVVHVEEYETRLQARSREKYWKSGQGREQRDKMLIK